MRSARPATAALSVVATLVAGFSGIRFLSEGEVPEPFPVPAVGGVPTSPGTTPVPSPSLPDRIPGESNRSGETGESEKSIEGGEDGGGREKELRGDGPPEADEDGARRGEPLWRPADGFLSSAAEIDQHSISTWGQSNVTLTTTAAITALDMVIEVGRAGGVAEAGQWTSIPAEMITATVTEEKERFVYRFTLKHGTLAPGTYIFAAQYTHPEGPRNPGTDRYGAIATADGEEAVVTGAFS